MHFTRLCYRKILCSIAITLIVVTALEIVPTRAAPGLTLKWTANIGSTTVIGPLAADLVGDDRLEIVLTGAGGGSNVTVLNGTDGSVIWTVNPGGIGSHSPFEIADLNKDNIPEIIIAAGSTLVLHGNNGSVYWKNTVATADGHFPAVADIDGNGYPTIFVSHGVAADPGGMIYSLSHNGTILNTAWCWYPCFGGLTIGDTNSDGVFELYQGDRSADYPDASSQGMGVRALDAHTLRPLWNDSDILCSSHCPVLADVDKDGILDVIACDQAPHQGAVVLNSADGSVVTTGGKYRKGYIPSPSHSQPTVYDIDEDGNLELITCSSSNPIVWDLYTWSLDANLSRSAGEPPKVGDVTGDGKMDIIQSSGSGVYIYNSTYHEVDSVTGLSGARAFTLVQDVDGDDLNELIVVGDGPVYCFDTPASAPTPRARSNVQFYSESKCGAAEYKAPPGPTAPALLYEHPTDGATFQPLNPTLSIRATDFQGDSMNITFRTNATGTWQTITSFTNITNGVYNATPTSMNSHGTTYYWDVNASDTGSGSYTWRMFKFTTYQPATWWDDKWLYRKPIAIDHTQVAANLTDFPVLIDITDTDLASKAQEDGDDIAFTDYAGSQLDHEIEHLNGTSGKLVAWVKIPSLSSTADMLLYMYYGNPSACNHDNPSAVWDSNFLAVHHLSETSGTHYDSTINSNDGTPFGSLNQDIPGKINGADYFDSVDDYVRLPQIFTNETAFTLEAWFYSDGTMPDPQYIVSQWTAVPADYGGHLNIFQNASLQLLVNTNRSGVPVSLGRWYYVAGTFDGTRAKVYLDGLSRTSFSADSPVWPMENLFIGDRSDHQRKFHGLIDEVRVSDTPRSSEWIMTCYNNQFDPSSFYTLLDEENVPTPAQAPIISCVSPANGTTGVSTLLNQLSFNLTDYQGDLMSYTVTTSPNIGSDSGTNVGNGSRMVSISNLEYSTTYTWHVNVTDGTYWSNETFQFTTRNPPEYWWDNRWRYRKPITIDHTRVPVDLTDFPVLIDITDADLASKAQNDGDDIAFADYYGTKLDHELENFNYGTGELVAWVRIPNLSSTSDTTIYIYYGSPLSGEQNASGVWDPNFLAVHHLSETAGTHYDSTSNDNDGTPYGSLDQNVTGQIDGADDFDGVDDDIELPQVFTSETEFTVEAWFYAEAGSELDAGYIVSQFQPNIGFLLNVYHNTSLQLYVDGNNVGKAVSLNTWYYVAGTFDGSTAKLYLDAGVPTSFNTTLTWPSIRTFVGDRADRIRHWSGLIDEVRLSDVARSADWIRTCYNNQYDPSSFYTLGEEEAGPTPEEAPIVHDLSPEDGETNVSVYLSELSFNLTDYQSNLMNYTVTTVPDIGTSCAVNVGNGRYTVSLYYLTYFTTYTWYVNVTDGTHSTNVAFQFTTAPRPENWWNSNWLYRTPIAIDHTKVAANLADFPVLIDITDTDLASKAQEDGDDIAFTDYFGIKLDHEIELFNGTTGELVAWVRIPELSSTTDTTIYMYYGNVAASNQENATGVWDSNFLAVHHLEETSGTHYDSTSNNNDGTPYGSLDQDATGQIDGADYFDGSDDHLRLPQVFSSETEFTMEAWIYAETGARYFISQWSSNNGAFMQVAGTGAGVEWYINGVSAGSTVITLNTWYYFVATFNGSTAKLYKNGGTPVTKAQSAPNWPAENTYIGDRSGGGRQFHGIIDEVRLSDVVRSGDWVTTCFNNQYMPSSFYTVGIEERSPPTGTAMFVSPANTHATIDNDYTAYIEVAYVTGLYAWEFQLDYNQSILDITSVSIVAGGLNEPTQTYYNLTDETNGHLWWAVSTRAPTTSGISYDRHAIFMINFHTIGVGTSNLGLYGTHLSDNETNPIAHTVFNGSITVTGLFEIDLTVTSISILDLGCSIYANNTYTGGSEYYYPVEIIIYNYGASAAGQFYVKLEMYWIDGSLLEDSAEILVAGLSPGASTTVNFTSLFHPTHTGLYRLTATADSRNNITETSEANNTLTEDNIFVTVMGDISGDSSVNILDAVIVALAWNSTPSDPWWTIYADLNHDNEVNILDGVTLSLHWGQEA